MEQKIKKLVEHLKGAAEGKCAIALAGAHAKGSADASSDIDIYIFAEQAKPWEERKALLSAIADPGTTPWVDERFDAAPWSGGMDFQYQGTPVEAVGRTIARMDEVVFALNRTYFTGDKKLEAALSKLPVCPDALRPKVLDQLLTAPRDPAVLEEQRQLLQSAHRQLSGWVNEALGSHC